MLNWRNGHSCYDGVGHYLHRCCRSDWMDSEVSLSSSSLWYGCLLLHHLYHLLELWSLDAFSIVVLSCYGFQKLILSPFSGLNFGHRSNRPLHPWRQRTEQFVVMDSQTSHPRLGYRDYSWDHGFACSMPLEAHFQTSIAFLMDLVLGKLLYLPFWQLVDGHKSLR